MADNNEKIVEASVDEAAVSQKTEKKSNKSAVKRDNFFVRVWKRIVKFVKDTVGELKKVYWTPKDELIKNTKLVVITVVAFGVVIAIVDTVSSLIVNSIAGLIG